MIELARCLAPRVVCVYLLLESTCVAKLLSDSQWSAFILLFVANDSTSTGRLATLTAAILQREMEFESESVPWLLATYGAKTILAILTRVFNSLSFGHSGHSIRFARQAGSELNHF